MRRRDAFTLIELLMVVLVVGILASVAIPTYTGQRDRAETAAVTSDLEAVLRSARAEYTKNDGSYPSAASVAAAAQTDHPSITVGAGSAFGSTVQVAVPNAQRVELRRQATRQQANEMIVDDRTPGSEQTIRLHGYKGDPAGLPAITNQTMNPGVESGTAAHWVTLQSRSGVASSTFSVSTDGCREGRYCAQVEAFGGTGAGAYFGQFVSRCNTSCSPAQLLELAAVGAGDRAAVRCSARVVSGSIGEIKTTVHLFNAAGNKVAGHDGDRVDNPQVGEWYDLGGVTTTFTHPDAIAASARVNFGDVTGDVVVQMGRCMLVVNPPGGRLPAYFDGRAGGTWQGASDGSRSDGYLAQRISSAD